MATKKAEPKKLPPRIHLNEFVGLYTQFDEMRKAGFKVFCGKEWMTKDEWQAKLDEYLK